MIGDDIELTGPDPLFEEAPKKKRKKKKRKKSTSPTARTLDECKRRGWIAGVVEKRIPFPKPQGTTIDLFGCIDVVGIVTTDPMVQVGRAIIGIQATSGSNHDSRRSKMLAEPRMRAWVEAGGRLELWSWSQRVARKQDGSKAKRPVWTLRVETYQEMLRVAGSEAG